MLNSSCQVAPFVHTTIYQVTDPMVIIIGAIITKDLVYTRINTDFEVEPQKL